MWQLFVVGASAATPDWSFAAPPGYELTRAEPPATAAFRAREGDGVLIVRWEETRAAPLDPGEVARSVGAGRFVVKAQGGAAADAVAALLASGGPPLSRSLHARACAEPCGGKGSVTPWRGATGEIQRVSFTGDRSQCSHVVTVWWDPTGGELYRATDKPMVPADTAALAKRLDALRSGVTAGAPLDCPP